MTSLVQSAIGSHSDVIKFPRCFDVTHRSERWFIKWSSITFQLLGFFHWTGSFSILFFFFVAWHRKRSTGTHTAKFNEQEWGKYAIFLYNTPENEVIWTSSQKTSCFFFLFLLTIFSLFSRRYYKWGYVYFFELSLSDVSRMQNSFLIKRIAKRTRSKNRLHTFGPPARLRQTSACSGRNRGNVGEFCVSKIGF